MGKRSGLPVEQRQKRTAFASNQPVYQYVSEIQGSNTSYYAPYYEPATQQFQVQDEVKVGNYPLVNAYVNFHLKQARFFVMGYNLGSKFVNPNYFSLAHYPLDPFVLKMGVAVTFNN